jgi:Domain of unknown function (DUF1877)
MGMTCTLYRVVASETKHLRANPAAVEELMFPPGSTPPMVEVREKGLTGWLLHLVGVKITQVDPNWIPPEGAELDGDRELDLEGVWHGLHYILTGTAWEGKPPASFLILGGEEIGDEDDDNPPRLLEPNQVRELSAFLAALSDEEFLRRFDAERMTALDIHPAIWKQDKDPNPIELLQGGFDELRQFVATAAEHGEAIVVHLG